MAEPERRVADAALVERLRAAIKAERARGHIPTELRLGQEAWNGVSPEMRFGPFGRRKVMLFDGLPCVLLVGLQEPQGFVVQSIAPRD